MFTGSHSRAARSPSPPTTEATSRSKFRDELSSISTRDAYILGRLIIEDNSGHDVACPMRWGSSGVIAT